MKKLFAFLLTFSLLFCNLPVLAESGTADVIMEGENRGITRSKRIATCRLISP